MDPKAKKGKKEPKVKTPKAPKEKRATPLSKKSIRSTLKELAQRLCAPKEVVTTFEGMGTWKPKDATVALRLWLAECRKKDGDPVDWSPTVGATATRKTKAKAAKAKAAKANGNGGNGHQADGADPEELSKALAGAEVEEAGKELVTA